MRTRKQRWKNAKIRKMMVVRGEEARARACVADHHQSRYGHRRPSRSQHPCAFLRTVWINAKRKNTREGITVDEEKGERGEGGREEWAGQ